MQNPEQIPAQDPSQRPDPEQADRLVALRLPTSRLFVTYVLLATIAIVYLAQLVTRQLYYPDQPMLRLGAIDYRAILRNGEYYRLLTAMFLHVSPAHAFFNGLALWQFGQSVERFFGPRRFAIIYLLGGLCGSIASFILTRGLSAGASGAILAIAGAEMAFLYQNRRLLGPASQREQRSLVIWLLIVLGVGFYTQYAQTDVVIDNWAHIGGFVAGFVLAWFISPRYVLQTDLTAPTGYHVEDGNPFTRTWIVPAAFSVALVITVIIAAAKLSPFR
jgi:membrane associated rhomboid family serine protease